MTEIKPSLRRGVSILGMAVGLAGCASFFDELDRAAVIAEQWRAEEDASRPPVFVPDYSIGARIAGEGQRRRADARPARPASDRRADPGHRSRHGR